MDSSASLNKANILIVDDEAYNLYVLKQVLSRVGHRVRLLVDGQLTVEAAQTERPDLILLDVMMPNVDGYEICSQLKANQQTRYIPVIFISASDTGGEQVKAFALGAVDYIIKPFDIQEVIARVENQLKMSKLQQQLREQNEELQREIRERKLLEEKLRSSQEEIRGFFEAMADIVLLVNAKGNTLQIAPTNADRLYPQGTHILDKTVEAFFTEQGERFRGHIQQALSCQKVVNCEYSLSINEQQVWFSASIAPTSDHTVIWVARDITDRYRTEAKLKQSQAQLAAAQRVAHVGNWEWEPNTRTITCSEEAFRIFGLAQSQGQPTFLQFLRLIDPQDRQDFKQKARTALTAKKPYKLDLRLILPDKSFKHIEVRGETIINSQDGTVEKLFGTVLDITARKRGETDLRLLLETTQAINQSPNIEQALTQVLSLISQAINWDFAEAWFPSSDQDYLELNCSWYSHNPNLEDWRSNREKLILSTGVGLPGKVWASGQAEWIETLTQGEETEIPAFVKSAFAVPVVAEGKVLMVLVFFSNSLRRKNQRLLNLVGVVATQFSSLIRRQQIEQNLRQSEERLQLALEGSNLAIWDWNLITGNIYPNPAWKTMLGYEPSEIDDHLNSFYRLLYPPDVTLVRNALSAYLEGKTPFYEVEFRMQSKSGEWKWILCRGKISERNSQGVPIRMTGTHRDISEHKVLEQELALREARLNAFFNGAPIGMGIVNRQLEYVQVNELLAEINGCPAPDHIGKALHEVVPHLAPMVAPLYQQVLDRGEPILNLELTGELPSQPGVTRHWVASYFPISQKDALPSGVGLVVMEITNLKRTKLELQLAKERLQHLLEASPAVIFSLKPFDNWAITFISENVRSILGYSSQVFLNDPDVWRSLIHPHDFAQIPKDLPELFDQEFYNHEYRIRHANKTYRWLYVQLHLVRDEQGQPLECVGYGVDISDRKQAEEALWESARREQALSIVIQKMRQTLDINTIFDVTTSEVRQVINCDRVLVYRFNSDWTGQCVAESVGNDWSPLLNDSRFHLDDFTCQNPSCFLKNINQCNNLVAEIYWKIAKGRVGRQDIDYLAVDDIYAAKFDLNSIQLLELLQAKAYLIVPIFCGEQLWGLLSTYQNSNPRHWKEAEISIVVHIGNQLGIALQQAELLQQTQEQSNALQQALLAADTANRAKSEFLASMSHELRTPLNAILGFSQVMSHDTSLSEENQKNLSIINRAGEHLLALIDDILEVSKIEAGRTTFNKTSFNLLQLLDSLKAMLQLKTLSKGLQLLFEYDPNLPQSIKTDEGKLRQVLLNLLGNAIKFTQEGGVTLRVRAGTQVDPAPDLFTPNWGQFAAPSDPSPAHPELITQESASGSPGGSFPDVPNRLYFEVEDTGPGIALEELSLLFEAFSQTETGRKSQQGTGLGLPISQKYVQLMGGDIQVQSSLSRGCIFAFDIEIELGEVSETQTTKPEPQIICLAPDQPEYRILVADDNAESRLLLFKILTSAGFTIREATNGEEAVQIWESWQPDLIFMDMQMAVMDGYQATQNIRFLEQQRSQQTDLDSQAESDASLSPLSTPVKPELSRTIILALTASSFEEQRQKILSMGCDELIRKPFQIGFLLGKLSDFLGVKYLDPTEAQLAQHYSVLAKKLSYAELINLLLETDPEWLIKVYDSTAECSDEKVLQLIQEMPTYQKDLAQALTELTENFEFGKIMYLIDECNKLR